MYIRKNVWELGGDWADPVLWYARAIADMQQRPLNGPTSWRFYAAIHGLDLDLWRTYGYLSDADVQPTPDLVARYWNQCQHGTWYFLPWHRGYLLNFEAVVRATVVKLGGPADWALPYWNYFVQGQAALPPAFGSQTWPDGNGPNPLYREQRYGPGGDHVVTVPLDSVNLDPMTYNVFEGAFVGGTPGFGGPITKFHHDNGRHGGLETQPHDQVHGFVGGLKDQDMNFPGLMSDPDTAALDSIFWLHHANIDRLWEVWRRNPPSHIDPTDPKWLGGPASTGDQRFSVPNPDGTGYDYTPNDMVDLDALGYGYDDYSAAAPAPSPGERLLSLGATQTVASAARESAMVPPGQPELVGANAGPLSIVGSHVATTVSLEAPERQALTMSLSSAVTGNPPDRVYLNLENLTGARDGAVLKVYVGLGPDENPEDHPDLLAGNIVLFGVRKATAPDGGHAGQGITYVLDITKIADALHVSNALDVDMLGVRIVPAFPVPATAEIKVGRISIYRQAP